jgi:hypothetical protein
LHESVHGNNPVVDPIIQRSVADLDFGQTQLSVKLRSAAKLPNQASHIHLFHGENRTTVRGICVQ